MNLKLNRGLTLLALLFSFGNSGYAQSLQLQWAKAIAGTHNVSAGEIVLDSAGNLYVPVSYQGTVDLDPGPGTAIFSTDTALAQGRVALLKFDPQGNLVFAKDFQGSGRAFISSLTLDNSGNICIAGTLTSSVDFDPGPASATLTSAGSSDVFVARYDAGGNYINAFRIGGSGIDGADAITADAGGNVYVAGTFTGTVDFDPDGGTLNLMSSGSFDNIFLAKYSSNGAVLFAFRLISNLSPEAVVVDATGNVYLSGNFTNSIDLDPSAATANFTAVAGNDGFWAKYSPGGNYLTGRTYQGGVNMMAFDGLGNFYISGRVPDSMDMDLGPGVAMIYSVNFFDIYVAKYDPSGNYLYASAFKSNKTYIQNGIVLDHKNNLYMAGWFPDTVFFNPASNTNMMISNGGRDAFLTKYDATGNYKEGISFGSTGNDDILGLALGQQGSVWIAGRFYDTVDFDPGAATVNLTATPTRSGAFIGRYLDQTTGIPRSPEGTRAINVYGTDDAVVVDFTSLEKVQADIKVVNLLGQTIAEAKHSRNDMLKIYLPDAIPQLYVVTIRNGASTTAKKVWVR